MDLNDYVTLASEIKASDIHLFDGDIPYCRGYDGNIQSLHQEQIPRGTLIQLFRPFMSSVQEQAFKENGDVDMAEDFGEIRTRINLFRSNSGLCAVLRLLKSDIPSMNQLGLPMAVQNLIHKEHGLVLFTAATGNGKSTSIAALLAAINATQTKRIITIEDPVEYLHCNSKSIISQREVGRDVKDFASGLRSALREDPDIIMIGEMRDRETILAAVAAAESGHLVFSTLHSADVIQAADRILQYFPASQQEIIQMQFANAFEAVIAQKLLLRKDKNGRVAAFEVLLKTDATKNLIRTGNSFNLRTYMPLKEGMQTMNYSIGELKRKGIIS